MIINIVGASGSGKTTLARLLGKDGYNIIQSYTTRPRRSVDEWGHEFIENYYPVYVNDTFVGLENPIDEQYIDIDDMIAYFIKYPGLCYFATREQVKDNEVNIYVVDPGGAKQVHENVKDMKVITIFIRVDSDTTLGRMLEDNRSQHEIETRLNHDKCIFSVCKCDYVVDGDREVNDVLSDIIQIIEGEVI